MRPITDRIAINANCRQIKTVHCFAVKICLLPNKSGKFSVIIVLNFVQNLSVSANEFFRIRQKGQKKIANLKFANCNSYTNLTIRQEGIPTDLIKRLLEVYKAGIKSYFGLMSVFVYTSV